MALQLDVRRERLAAGEQPLGWKVGFGAPTWLEQLGLTAPLVGFMTDAALIEPGETVDVSEWIRSVAEPEIAVHLGADVPGGAGQDQVRAAISGLSTSIELADVEFPPEDIEQILAGNIYHRRLALGAMDPERAGGWIDDLRAVIEVDGERNAETADLEALTGELIWVVKSVADLLDAAGERLRAGEIIIAGSVVPPIPGAEVGEVTFRLDPLEPVTVYLSSRSSDLPE
jgi:2-keto-4-pentenoate hydratase